MNHPLADTDQDAAVRQAVTQFSATVLDLLNQRNDAMHLCGDILATLQLQRNQAPLTEAGVKVDELLTQWNRRYNDNCRVEKLP